MDYQHKSVLTKEVIDYLNPQDGKIYIDCTFGGGGHTKAILDSCNTCKVISFDLDTNAIENGAQLQEQYPDRLDLVWANFGHITKVLKKKNINKVDGILADFGTSQFQIAQQAGFSFATNTPLDMRMSPGHTRITAATIVNQASEQELAKIFYDYGQENKSYKVARAIVNYRQEKGPIETTDQLVKIVNSVIPPYSRHINSATKVFQALRIVVNDELGSIKSLLKQSIDLLNPGGRLVCISFHSLEDRIVKHFLRENKDKFGILTPKVIIPSQEELDKNPSSRSSKLRSGELK